MEKFVEQLSTTDGEILREINKVGESKQRVLAAINDLTAFFKKNPKIKYQRYSAHLCQLHCIEEEGREENGWDR